MLMDSYQFAWQVAQCATVVHDVPSTNELLEQFAEQEHLPMRFDVSVLPVDQQGCGK